MKALIAAVTQRTIGCPVAITHAGDAATHAGGAEGDVGHLSSDATTPLGSDPAH